MKVFNWNSGIEKDMNSIYKKLDRLEKMIEGFYTRGWNDER